MTHYKVSKIYWNAGRVNNVITTSDSPFEAYCLRAPTDLKFKNQHSAHAVFICFVFISEQTATFATYSLNRLVFITEMKGVYSAVRTGSLNG